MSASAGEIASGQIAPPMNSARGAPIWLALALALLASLFVLFHNADLFELGLDSPNHGAIGLSSYKACPPDGFCEVGRVEPGSPAAIMGVHVGDGVRFDHGIDGTRVLRVGEVVSLTLRRGGLLSRHVLTAASQPRAPRYVAISSDINFAMSSFIGVMGLFVLFRSRLRAAALLLGAGLVCLSLMGSRCGPWESDPRFYAACSCVASLILYGSPILFLAFAMAARRESGQVTGRAWMAVLIAYATAQIIVTAYFTWIVLSLRTLPGTSEAFFAFLVALQDLGFILTFLVLMAAWRESRGDARTRFAFLLFATGLLAASIDGVGFAINLTGDNWSPGNPLVVVRIVGSIAGTLVLAYAILRHRVVDLGFAVNRTLVYTAVSAALLTTFGLVEWAVDHFVPIAGREKNVLVDAAVAVGVFLTFHRARDAVEHGVEGVFFRRWQQAEAALRQFVREAAFVKSRQALNDALIAALSRFAEVAEAALYMIDDAGGHRVSGRVSGVGELIEIDDPLLVALRADPKPLEPGETQSSLPAALAAPMLHRNEVIGIVLLGRKPHGLSYRPDEIELIGWATQQVGLDLHALKVEQLEAAVAALRQENGTLRSVIPQRA